MDFYFYITGKIYYKLLIDFDSILHTKYRPIMAHKSLDMKKIIKTNSLYYELYFYLKLEKRELIFENNVFVNIIRYDHGTVANDVLSSR